MSALTPKELADFRWKVKQEYPNFGRRQIKKLFAYLDEQIARVEQAEAERDWLVNKIVEMGEGHEHAVCPALDTPCAPASYDCTICWNKAATEAQRKEAQ
ncbi:MAG: hypothetical protein LBD42_03050 [Desulfovibrio sp.]|jgi:hypothetical protein|nr:hypothetical protein [Desulfovibrio sp.]